MGAPNSLLPVFSFRPNWGAGVTEQLEWMTDIPGGGSQTGAEQRISQRLSPRRNFDVQIEPINSERTFLDLFIRRFSNQEFMLPLWHDHALLTASVSAGASSLPFDTTDREFVDGGMAILIGADAFSCEAVQIGTVSSGSVTLSAPTANAWGTGATIHPLRRSWLMEQPKGKRQTDSFDAVPMRFLLSGPSDYDGGAEELTTYAGLPILSPAPDWSDTLDMEFIRNLPDVDGKVGLRTLGDPAGRSFSTQMHRWFLHGRSEQSAFRRLMSRLRGKQGPLWLPTFGSDLIVAATASPGDTHIDVRECGLNYADFPDVGRDHAITAAGEMLSLTALAASPGPGIERITLSAPLTGGLAVGDALSFVDVGRLDSDVIEIHHQTDSDGVAQVELPFRTFPDIRDGSGLSAVPLPEATMSDAPCGEAGDCQTLETAAFPFTAEATFPVGYDDPMLVSATHQMTVPLWMYRGAECPPSCYYFTLIASGPMISYYQAAGEGSGGASVCLSKLYYAPAATIDCGSQGNPVVTFDFTCTVMVGDYALEGRFYYDGTTMGMELTNPTNAALALIPNPNPDYDFTLPLFGTTPMDWTAPTNFPWFVTASSEHPTFGVGGWSEALALAHDFNITVTMGGATISVPYQMSGHVETTYEPDYAIIDYAGLSTNNPGRFPTDS